MTRFNLTAFLAQTEHNAEATDGGIAAIAAYLSEREVPPECVRHVVELVRATLVAAGPVLLPVGSAGIAPEAVPAVSAEVRRHIVHWTMHAAMAWVEVWHLERGMGSGPPL